MRHSLPLSLLLLLFAQVQAAVPESLSLPQAYTNTHPGFVHTTPPPAYAPDRILVKFHPGTAASEMGQLMRESHAKSLKVISGIDVHVLQVPAGTVKTQLTRFKQNPNVLYAEPDLNRITTAFFPDEGRGVNNLAQDRYYIYEQWALNNIGQLHSELVGSSFEEAYGTPDADIDAPEAWDRTKGDPAVKIAILDSGIDCRLQEDDDVSSIEFGNDKCVEQRKFVTDYQSDTLEDVIGHGTHVAGIAAAQTNNGIGIAGVGFNSSVGNLKACYEYLVYQCVLFYCEVIQAMGVCPLSSSIDAITYAADNGYQVINMSYATDEIDAESHPVDLVGYSQSENDAVNYAWGKGVLLVGAAGNAGNTTKNYPAAYDNVIAVGATDDDDSRASFSTYGSDWVSLMAPGENIISILPNDLCGIFDYDKDVCVHWQSGTSMASPHVAGAAALLWADKYPDQLSNPETCQDESGIPCNQMIRMMLEQGADSIGAGGQDLLNISQYGRLNLIGALTATPSTPPPPPPPPPSVEVTSPDNLVTTVTNGIVSLFWSYSGELDGIDGFRVERESWNAKRNRWQSVTSWEVLDPAATTFDDSSASGEVHYRVGTIQKTDGTVFWTAWTNRIELVSSGGGKGGGNGKGGGKPNK